MMSCHAQHLNFDMTISPTQLHRCLIVRFAPHFPHDGDQLAPGAAFLSASC